MNILKTLGISFLGQNYLVNKSPWKWFLDYQNWLSSRQINKAHTSALHNHPASMDNRNWRINNSARSMCYDLCKELLFTLETLGRYFSTILGGHFKYEITSKTQSGKDMALYTPQKKRCCFKYESLNKKAQ